MKGRKKKYQNPEEAKKVQKEKIRLWRLKNKDRIKLIVKGTNHNIDGSAWTTTLETQSTPTN